MSSQAAILRQSKNYVWNLNDVLGQGATGSVYRCRHKKSGESFAVKTFNVMSTHRPLDVQMREFDVLQKCDHPNIVKLLAIEEDQAVNSKVIIMELCGGGSLYSMLDDPANSFGLPEHEFLLVLEHVASGLQHLRDQSIIHRDIKPGNILRYITEDGSSIYKLTDFGAARELAEEGQFMSLYGTEEYLHPDMYERAVLRQPSAKQFGATVDLWSLGVTLYHVAVGQLPFRPYGGRKNKPTMHRITTQKESGVISGIQYSDKGEIHWSKTLPEHCLISHGLKTLITPLLAGLLECQPKQMWSFERFFTEAFSLCAKTVIYVFNVWSGSHLRIYMKKDESYAKFQELIAEQTDISANNQVLLLDGQHFSHMVQALLPAVQYPHTSQDYPIFLYSKDFVQCPKLQLFNIPELPQFPSSAPTNLDADFSVAKTCGGSLHLMQKLVKSAVHRQRLMDESVKLYGEVLVRDMMQFKDYATHFTCICDETKKRVQCLSEIHRNNKRAISIIDKLTGNNEWARFVSTLDGLTDSGQRPLHEMNIGNSELKRFCDDNYENLVKRRVLTSGWRKQSGCTEKERCVQKLDILVENTSEIVHDFRKNKMTRRLQYNEEHIHHISKNRLTENCAKATSLLQDHCYRNLKQVHASLATWLERAYKVHANIVQMDGKLHDMMSRQKGISKNQDKVEGDYSKHLDRWLSEMESSNTQLKSLASSSGSMKSGSMQKTLLKQVNEDLQSLRLESGKIKSIILDNNDLVKKLEDLSIMNGQAEVEMLDSVATSHES
ncbi:serine/threonine-protein kinase TBK1-like [Lineus longissimus]|uniref:serine/threonine-protein kinase TBK1-like n=1 Tax=Lineus longissimus TaxID=88925 RepID=UPI002B4D0B21